MNYLFLYLVSHGVFGHKYDFFYGQELHCGIFGPPRACRLTMGLRGHVPSVNVKFITV